MKQCDICEKPLIIGKNATSDKNIRCSNPADTKKLSKCQKIKNLETSKESRRIAREKGEKTVKSIEYYKKTLEEHKMPALDTSQKAMRTCLRCDEDENGCIPAFMSNSPHNRICDECSTKAEGIPIRHFQGTMDNSIKSDFKFINL